MKGLFTAFLFLALLVYGAYSGFMALQFYLEQSNLVEEVVQRDLPTLSGDRGWRSQDRTRKIRDAIIKASMQASIPIDPAGVLVTEEAGVLWVQTTFRYQVVKLPQNYAINIPISTSHSFKVP